MSDIENGRKVYEALLEGTQKLFDHGVMSPTAFMNPESREDLVAYLLPLSEGTPEPDMTESVAVLTLAGLVQVEPNNFCEPGKVYMVDPKEADRIIEWAREAEGRYWRRKARLNQGMSEAEHEAREAARDEGDDE